MSMDLLMDTLLSDAQIECGNDPRWIEASSGIVRGIAATPKPARAREWSPAEDTFLQEHLDKIGYEGVAEALGRSLEAIHIRQVRSGANAPSRYPGWATGHQVARLLGIDGHVICGWIDSGVMPGERLPFSMRLIRRVNLYQLKRWLIRPENWIYFDVNRIQHAHLRRLVLLAKQRWGDEWLNMRQVADLLGCETGNLNQKIRRGQIEAVQAVGRSGRHKDPSWANWFMRRSVAEKIVIYHGKGTAQAARQTWHPRSDAFILRQRAEGKLFSEIAKMMGWKQKRVEYRFHCLKKGMK